MSDVKQFDGSRRHVLDWVDSASFLKTLRAWVGEFGLSIAETANWMPKSWREPQESKLFEVAEPFLTRDQRDELQDWWLAHKGNIPNWDVIVSATMSHLPALVLVEAKANIPEFDCNPKRKEKRETPEQQKKTDENHDQIGRAIDEAARALAKLHPDIRISRDDCYQLSNRIATAWKLASIGIPSALVFVGFTGDREIAADGKYFADEDHWQSAFAKYAEFSFPTQLLGCEICCGAASFWVLAKSLPVARLSRPLTERRRDRASGAAPKEGRV